MRRSHHALTPTNYALCPQCHEPTLPHRICSSCGYYAGRAILDVKD